MRAQWPPTNTHQDGVELWCKRGTTRTERLNNRVSGNTAKALHDGNRPPAEDRSAMVSEKAEPTGLSDEARERIGAELARLRERRDRLEAEVRNDRGSVSDHADAADAIQRADELVGLDERLAELDRLLHAGPLPSTGDDQLPFGTQVKLKFSDGAVVKMQVISVIEETALDGEAEALTARSPLGLALAGRKAGDVITYTTPQGENQVELLDLKYPS
jgi:transcription elongation GreA/GreB family factor